MTTPTGLIVAWPSTVASIPAGWSRYAALDDKVPKPASASIGSTGGSDSHIHSVASHTHPDTHQHTGTTGSGGTGGAYSATGGNSVLTGSHGHTFYLSDTIGLTTGAASGSSSSGSSLGIPRYSVIWIQSDGTTDIPVGAVAWSNANPVPTGWTAHAASINHYLRGAAVGADGGTATAAASHNHTYSHTHTHSTDSHTHSPISPTDIVFNNAANAVATGASTTFSSFHTHPASGTSAAASHSAVATGSSSATATNATLDLAYHKLQHISATSAGAAPQGVIGMFASASAPTGWYACDGANGTPNINGSGRFIKGASGTGEIGSTGGSNSHSHTGSHNHIANTGLSNHGAGSISFSASGSTTLTVVDGATSKSTVTHTHAGATSASSLDAVGSTSASYGSVDHQPAYVQMFFIMSAGSTPLVVAPVAIPLVVPTPTLVPGQAILSLAPVAIPVAVAQLHFSPTYLGVSPVAVNLVVGAASLVLNPTFPQQSPAGVVSDAEIADALSGRYGSVTTRLRAERRTHGYEFIDDISGAFLQADIVLDNFRPIAWAARFKIRPALLPANFDRVNDHVAIHFQIRVGAAWASFPRGIYHLDEIDETEDSLGLLWDAAASDLSIHLLEADFTESYVLTAGIRYTDAAAAIGIAAGLRVDIPPSPLVAPNDIPWTPNTSKYAVMEDLLKAVNYFPPYADQVGIISSRPRVDPFSESEYITYTNAMEPRMMRPAYRRKLSTSRFPNRFVVGSRTPRREPQSVEVVNDDDDSAISTLIRGTVTTVEFPGDRMPSLAVMQEFGEYEARLAACRSQAADLGTSPDPRRGNHEHYEITLSSGSESASRWIVFGWSLRLQPPGATMVHHLGRAAQLDLTAQLLAGEE